MSTATKFRKKPVVIEAVQLTADNLEALSEWSGGAVRLGVKSTNSQGVVTRLRAAIDTLEGTMTAEVDDWIIRGVKGEFYPCKPDIFEATYEQVPA